MNKIAVFLKGISWIVYALILFGLIAFGSSLWQWFHPKVVTPPTVYVDVPVEKVVTKIKPVKVKGPTEIVTIEKEKIVKVLDLPDWIKNDPNKQVIANGEVPPYKGKTSVVTVLDTVTGEARMQMKPKPLPFFSFENEQAIGAGYGISTDKGTVMEVHARWTFARVGNLYAQGYGEINSGSKGDNKVEGKALLQIEYRR